MPKLSNSLPKYRKHRGSGQAIVTLNGRDFYLGPHGTKASKLEYDRLIGEWLQHGRQIQPSIDSGGLTVAELIVAYMNHVKMYYVKDGRQTSEVRDIAHSLRPVKLLYSRQPVNEFGPTALKAVRQRMVDDGLGRNTVNQRAGRVVRMFRWGAASELLPASIPQSLSMVEGLRRGRTEAHETAPVLPVADAIIDATLPHLPEVVADMVRLQRLTGMRPMEVCILRPVDLDRTGDVWTYRPESHKTQHHGKDRTVFIGPQGQGILLKYLARDPGMYCFRPFDSEEKRLAIRHACRKTPLCCGNKPGSNRQAKPKSCAGDVYDVVSYRQAIYRGCDKAFPWPAMEGRSIASLNEADRNQFNAWRAAHRWAPNRLRHTAATQIRRDFGLEAAQIALGHSQANVTQVYAARDTAKVSRSRV